VSTTSDRTERKRAITRWNRRLGWALVVTFPLSYGTAWLSDRYPDGSAGSWLSLLDVLAQVIGTIVLLTHAGYSFFVFGFPAPRLTLRAVNGYLAYVVLFVYLLSQVAVGIEPQHLILTLVAFACIGLHVAISIVLRSQRADRDDPDLGQDTRALLTPDAVILDEITRSIEQGAVDRDAPPLAAEELDVVLGQVQVLYGVSLSLAPGEVVALMGSNGAGKTTTLRTLAGLQRPVTGSVRLDGFDATGLSPTGRSVLGLRLVVGGQAVFGPLTVRENLDLFGATLEVSDAERATRARDVLDAFPWLADRQDQLASTLSGGEQQMLAVAQALLVQPRVLLIDEFSLGLSPLIVGQLIEVIRMIAARGTAVLLVEQSASVALDLVDRVYLMEKGRIVLEETSTALRENPQLMTEVLVQGSGTVAP
jgi:branched-chain amino acid transport system ATP-binding protein